MHAACCLGYRNVKLLLTQKIVQNHNSQARSQARSFIICHETSSSGILVLRKNSTGSAANYHSLTCSERTAGFITGEDSNLLAFLAVGGFTGVATQVISLSAGALLCGRLQDGWHRGAERPNMAVLSI